MGTETVFSSVITDASVSRCFSSVTSCVCDSVCVSVCLSICVLRGKWFKQSTSKSVMYDNPCQAFCMPGAVVGKIFFFWGGRGRWPLIIWEATTAKRNYYRNNNYINQQQNYCVQLSSIRPKLPWKNWGLGKIWGLCPLAPT